MRNEQGELCGWKNNYAFKRDYEIITSTVSKYEHAINATPDGKYADGKYAIRILESYLKDTKYLTTDNTEGKPPKNELLIELNKAQEKRRKELEKAINILKEHNKP
jgi:hypothetical protein